LILKDVIIPSLPRPFLQSSLTEFLEIVDCSRNGDDRIVRIVFVCTGKQESIVIVKFGSLSVYASGGCTPVERDRENKGDSGRHND
jgi:hypothetical protein